MSATDAAPARGKATYSLDFVSVGANRQANSSSWGLNGLVAYAGSKFVGIYDPIVRRNPVPIFCKRFAHYKPGELD